MTTLRLGEPFPQIEAETTNGEHMSVPEGVDSTPTILLFYRGHF